MTTLTSDDLISEITAELSKLPYAQRVAAVHAYQKLLEEPEAMELKYAWPLHARDSQLPPEEDWDTWLILAGRGFGKTRTGAEWVRAQSLPRTPIRGPRPPRTPNSPRRTYPPRSTVLADESGRLTPNGWALRAIHLYEKFNAHRIVVEDNAGGQMAEATIQNAVDRTISIKTLHARRGKYIRAEPIASLYEQSRVHHVGRFPELEDQMCTWNADLGPSHSPDRADALVHAITDLILDRNPIMIW